jgi:MerR family transcriptional regulator, heat shock protein HspR
MKREKGYFSISAVAKMFSVHPQTVRLYEKEGLIVPKRSDGNTRMFSEDDVNKLEEIIYLTHELGINLSGVEMIFKLKRQINKLQNEINKAFKETQNELQKEEDFSKNIIKRNATQLLNIKKSNPAANSKNREKTVNDNEVFDMGSWEIEYDQD